MTIALTFVDIQVDVWRATHFEHVQQDKPPRKWTSRLAGGSTLLGDIFTEEGPGGSPIVIVGDPWQDGTFWLDGTGWEDD